MQKTHSRLVRAQLTYTLKKSYTSHFNINFL